MEPPKWRIRGSETSSEISEEGIAKTRKDHDKRTKIEKARRSIKPASAGTNEEGAIGEHLGEQPGGRKTLRKDLKMGEQKKILIPEKKKEQKRLELGRRGGSSRESGGGGFKKKGC